MFHKPDHGRVEKLNGKPLPVYDGVCGYFRFEDALTPGRFLWVIASDGMGWEHVSVSAHKGNQSYTPMWGEMCFVKDLFWDEEDAVMQLHPRKSLYVNLHPHALHLWRPSPGRGIVIPEPDPILVGPMNIKIR